MRPIELIVEGFTSFRTRQTLDFLASICLRLRALRGRGKLRYWMQLPLRFMTKWLKSPIHREN